MTFRVGDAVRALPPVAASLASDLGEVTTVAVDGGGVQVKWAAGGSSWVSPEHLEHVEKVSVMRHPNSARFHEILQELGDLHDRKQRDYGRGDDPFANVRASVDWEIPSWVGAMLRLTDKVKRLQSLRANGQLANESAEDSFRDIAVYAVIALVLFEQESKATGGEG